MQEAIDAIINLTASDNREIDENAKMFLLFLREKHQGVYTFDTYLQSLAIHFVVRASETSDWRQEVYKEKFYRELCDEFTAWLKQQKGQMASV